MIYNENNAITNEKETANLAPPRLEMNGSESPPDRSSSRTPLANELSIDPAVVLRLLIDACPERKAEISEAFKVLQPSFYLKKDSVGAALGARGNQVGWAPKTFALDWAISTLGMKALEAYVPHILSSLWFRVPLTGGDFADDENLSDLESHMDEVVYFARSLSQAERLEDVEWPPEIPAPGTCPDPQVDPMGKATFDLACLAVAASLFHEMRHVQFSTEGDSPSLAIDEEHACDEHARAMLLDGVDEYCAINDEPNDLVLDKRIDGLVTLALCIAHVSRSGMQAAIANSHPSTKERFRTFALRNSAAENADSWLYAGCVLIHLLRRENRMPAELTFSSTKDLCAQLVELL